MKNLPGFSSDNLGFLVMPKNKSKVGKHVTFTSSKKREGKYHLKEDNIVVTTVILACLSLYIDRNTVKPG